MYIEGSFNSDKILILIDVDAGKRGFPGYMFIHTHISSNIPHRKVHWANMGPTWVLSPPDGPHAGPMNLAINSFYLISVQIGIDFGPCSALWFHNLETISTLLDPCEWNPLVTSGFPSPSTNDADL